MPAKALTARAAPRRPRIAHRTVPSFGLALAMHALLFVGMSIAVRWKTDAESPAVAQLWGALPPVMEVAPPPPPPPAIKPEPKPEPAPLKTPDIVEKQEKKAPPKKEEKKPDIDKKKLEEQQRQQELEDFRKLMAAQVEKQVGPTQQTPTAGRGDPTYNALLASIIKFRIEFPVPENTSPSVYADVQVEVLPTGEVVDVRIVKSSGMPEYDAAVERAVRRSSPLPKRNDGTVGPTIPLRFRPVEVR